MIELIAQRLQTYSATNPVEEEQALKEILQEIALYGLWRSGFFDVAAFHGGTSLRILHQLPRFSEDLDFILQVPDRSFDWTPYLKGLTKALEEFGLRSQVLDKSRMDQAVRKALLKDDSIAAQLNLKFYRGRAQPAIRIKIEIDANPPSGSQFTSTFIDFPLDFSVRHQDLPSNFAQKIHALLCRPYVKGRDWYDFNWYIKQGVHPNLALLQAALEQHGPWKDQTLKIDEAWVRAALSAKVSTLDWKETAHDVERFLGAAERHSLSLWGNEFFLGKVSQLTAGGE